MNYPLISEYIEAIKAAEDNFEKLANLRPVFDDGQPVMTSGNFAVVFKMKDIETGKFYALKCFTKKQEGRDDAYHKIVEELKKIDSPYLISIKYLENELFVDTDQTTETEFPVLLMDWIEGKPLDKYLRENLSSKFIIESLLGNFYELAEWLVCQPFAHGDLKPDNILVKNDGTLVLVDYDGMYVPAMKGQKSREIGSPDFCHPLRNEEFFDEHIDDFSILSILLSLCIVYVNKKYMDNYGAEDRLLFSKNDYINIHKSSVFNDIPPIIATTTNYITLFENACENTNFHLKKGLLSTLNMLISTMTLYDIELARLGVEYCPKVNNTDIGPSQKEQTTEQQLVDGSTRIHEYNNKKKRLNSTKWQSALLINIFIILYIIINNTNIRSDEIWPVIGWGFVIGLVAWYFCFFDYIKRDGSFGNCIFAFILLPITFYYGIYSCICTCINFFKEWRNKS